MDREQIIWASTNISFIAGIIDNSSETIICPVKALNFFDLKIHIHEFIWL